MISRSAFCLFVLATFLCRISAATPPVSDKALRFDGNTITGILSSDSFICLPYEERAVELSRQIKNVLSYVRTRTGDSDLISILSRIKIAGSKKLEILDRPDTIETNMFLKNIRFATHLPQNASQIDIVREEVEYLREVTGISLDAKVIQKTLFGFSEERMKSFQLNKSVLQYIARAMVYRDIAVAHNAGPGVPDAEKLRSLLDLTAVQVAPHFENEIPGVPTYYDFNDLPLEILLRGMGACDRSAWVLSTLAYYAGLESTIVYLYKDMSGLSNHTVADVKADGVFRAVDPFNHRLYDKSVSRLSAEGGDFKYFCVFINPIESQALLPIMKLAEILSRWYIPDQRLFFNSETALASFVERLYREEVLSQRTPRREIEDDLMDKIILASDTRVNPLVTINGVAVGRWGYPFWLRGYYQMDLWPMMKAAQFPFLDDLREVRMKQLLGRYEETDALFESMTGKDRGPSIFQTELGYFMVLNQYLQNNISEMKKGVKWYESKYPNTPRAARLRDLWTKAAVPTATGGRLKKKNISVRSGGSSEAPKGGGDQ